MTHLDEAGPSDLDRLDPMCPFDRAKDWKRVGVLCCYFAQIVSVFRLNFFIENLFISINDKNA